MTGTNGKRRGAGLPPRILCRQKFVSDGKLDTTTAAAAATTTTTLAF